MASAIMDTLFQKSLEDLIKGLRTQMMGEARSLSKAMEEIHKEIKSTDHQTKAVALQKLTYLNMLQGFDMSWAAFHVVEVLSMPRFCHKKIGYLAASQSFQEDTEVLLLVTNQLRKDLTSGSEFEASLALECLACIATPDLARDLTNEVFTLLGSSKNLLRKKATVALLRLYDKNPDSVKITFKRLVENMEDSDPQVSCASVSVFCELAMKDPNACLPLAPEFYRILTNSSNNWMLIKVVKIFRALIPLEPRLGRKIVDPICLLMQKTAAKSLLFECIRTVISVLTQYEKAVALAAESLKTFLREEDPNLRYLGLQAIGDLMRSHEWVVNENRETIIRALSDPDISIQSASLRLVSNIINADNVCDIVRVLMRYNRISSPEFSNEILGSILSTCCNNCYEYVVDFDWYVSLLGEIGRIPHCRHGKEIERQLIDIGIRVKDARPELVQVARTLLVDPALLDYPCLYPMLSAAAWIAGEYVEYSKNSFEIIEALLQPRTSNLSSTVRSVYLLSLMKVFIFCCYSHLTTNMQSSSQAGKDMSTQFLLFEQNSQTDGIDEMGCNEEANTSCLKLSSGDSDGQNVGHANNSSIDEEALGTASTVPDPSRAEADIGDDFDIFPASDEQSQISNNLGREDGASYSIFHVIELIKLNVGPLCGNQDVEVQERACNMIGLIKALEESSSGLMTNETSHSITNEEPIEGHDVLETVSYMHSIFSEELGPVSSHTQGKVHVPEGLDLKDNLDDLVEFVGDEQPKLEGRQEHFVSQAREWEDISLLSKPSKEETVSLGESTSLLAAHRKRHGLYYLPTEKSETRSDEFLSIQQVGSLETSETNGDIIKLAEQSIFSKVSRQSKSRPLVVGSDEVSEKTAVTAKDAEQSKDSLISDAIKEGLSVYGNKYLLGHDEGKEILSTPSLEVSHSDARQRSKKSSKGKKDIDRSLSRSEVKIDGTESSRREKAKSKKHRHSKKSDKNASARNKLISEVKDMQLEKQQHQYQSSSKLVPQTHATPDFLL